MPVYCRTNSPDCYEKSNSMLLPQLIGRLTKLTKLNTCNTSSSLYVGVVHNFSHKRSGPMTCNLIF